MLEDLVEAVADLEEDEALVCVRVELERGTDPLKLLAACQEGMGIVGQRFEQCTYFIPELVLAAEILKKVKKSVEPYLASSPSPHRIGKIVIGTVKGDVHDIGKDIVAFMLDANGFEVIDLGVDVRPHLFVDKVKETGAPVVALSALLTVAFGAMKATVDAFRQAGMREQVRIMIGGAPVNEATQRYTGADAWGADAMTGVSLARGWMERS